MKAIDVLLGVACLFVAALWAFGLKDPSRFAAACFAISSAVAAFRRAAER